MSGIAETFTYSTSSGTPEIVWVVLALAAATFFIIAFAHKLRDETGDVSTTRVAFSLFGSVFCGLTAYFSLVIDVNTGAQTHALYQTPVVAILFAILSVILFANFIYSIMAPDIIKPERNDYKSPVDGHVRAEGKR
jgi:hypothetical protein